MIARTEDSGSGPLAYGRELPIGLVLDNTVKKIYTMDDEDESSEFIIGIAGKEHKHLAALISQRMEESAKTRWRVSPKDPRKN